MTIFPESLEEFARNSDHIDVEHLYTVVPAVVVAGGFSLRLGPIIEFVAVISSIPELHTVALIALKGVLGGAVGLFLYTSEETMFIANDKAVSKEKALSIVLVSTVTIGIAVEVVAPEIVNWLVYDVLQISAILLLGGMWYVHRLVDNWRLYNEFPHVGAGLLLLFAPYLPPII